PPHSESRGTKTLGLCGHGAPPREKERPKSTVRSDCATSAGFRRRLGVGFEGAGEIAGIAADVVNDDGHAATGSGAANALVKRDTGVGRHSALEGAEDEDVAIGFLFE